MKIRPFSEEEKAFAREYVDIIGPLAEALDILQG